MQLEFDLNTKLQSGKQVMKDKQEFMKEDRKDQRVDKQAENQRAIKEGKPIKKFESSGNDLLTGGIGL